MQAEAYFRERKCLANYQAKDQLLARSQLGKGLPSKAHLLALARRRAWVRSPRLQLARPGRTISRKGYLTADMPLRCPAVGADHLVELIAVQAAEPLEQCLFAVPLKVVKIPLRAQQRVLQQIGFIAFGLQVARNSLSETAEHTRAETIQPVGQ